MLLASQEFAAASLVQRIGGAPGIESEYAGGLSPRAAKAAAAVINKSIRFMVVANRGWRRTAGYFTRMMNART